MSALPAPPTGDYVASNNGSISQNDLCARSGRVCIVGVDQNGNFMPCSSNGVAGQNNGAYCAYPNYGGDNGTVTGDTYCAKAYGDVTNKNMVCVNGVSTSNTYLPCNKLGTAGAYFCQRPNNGGDNGTVSGVSFCIGGWNGPGGNKNMNCVGGSATANNGTVVTCTQNGTAAAYLCAGTPAQMQAAQNVSPAQTPNILVGIGNDNNLYTRRFLTDGWAGIGSGLVRAISQTRDGVIVGIGTDNKLYVKARFTDAWVYADVAGTLCLSMASLPDGSHICIGMDNKLYNRPSWSSGWTQNPKYVSYTFKSVALLQDNTVIMVGLGQQMYIYDGSGALNMVPTSCCIDSVTQLADGVTVGAVGGTLWYKTTLSSSWVQIANSGTVSSICAISSTAASAASAGKVIATMVTAYKAQQLQQLIAANNVTINQRTADITTMQSALTAGVTSTVSPTFGTVSVNTAFASALVSSPQVPFTWTLTLQSSGQTPLMQQTGPAPSTSGVSMVFTGLVPNTAYTLQYNYTFPAFTQDGNGTMTTVTVQWASTATVSTLDPAQLLLTTQTASRDISVQYTIPPTVASMIVLLNGAAFGAPVSGTGSIIIPNLAKQTGYTIAFQE